MLSLEDLKPGVRLSGILPDQPVIVVDVSWHGSQAVTLIYKRSDGQPHTRVLYRHDEESLQLAVDHQSRLFDADGALFRLAAEAYRIHLAHLFDPVLAVHTSLIEPLPHQITAVYEEMLKRQPLRFLLADDPGSGKTIMAGLLIKELIIRGDVRRCLIVAPGNLTTQWQDELWFKFQLPFEVLGRDSFEAAVSGNPFHEKDLLVIRLDQAARNDDWQARLRNSEWDLIIVDEAHKMSASYWGGELKRTQRYRLGEMLGQISRHLLLMTATPHNGKEEDFQLFMGLLDRDRFEGRARSGEEVETGDLMRRMQKEYLYRFDGRRLFPERRAYTVNYPLSPGERDLYDQVTGYVRTEFNRAEDLKSGRRGTVGFALTVLQRRLASSPEAIYQSLKRRRERLQKRLDELNHWRQDKEHGNGEIDDPAFQFDESFWQDFDEATAEEAEVLEEEVLDSATAARTADELKVELEILANLERAAFEVRHRGNDQKWLQLATLLQDNEHMMDSNGSRRKLVIFTEHRDTLRYLHEKITVLFGRAENITIIDGSVNRERRRAIEDRFRNDPDVHYLLATDAAGEGINLQRAHLMVNYDLPWNPNRLEQRFGRIHRIGQTEVCHLWNIVAGETREGYVYERLLRKLETESRALNGQVFDILGDLFTEVPLRQLLVEAIRYGEQPETRERLERAVDNAVDREHVRQLLEVQSLAADTLDLTQIQEIRADMERFQALRLQPHHIQAFFLEAFEHLGGTMSRREPGRFHISHVPATIRERAKELDTVVPVHRQYERVTFDKALINPPGQALADFICPGHPLLDTVVELALDRYRTLLENGAILVDETDPGHEPRTLYFLEQRIRDATQRVISQEVHFVEIDGEGQVSLGGLAPYLNYRPLKDDESLLVGELVAAANNGSDAAQSAMNHAILELVPRHLEQVRARREDLIGKTERAVQKRLTAEINHWDRQARDFRRQAQEGKPNARLNADLAQRRADELARRREARMAQLAQEKQIAADPPVIIGGALVVPIGRLLGDKTPTDIVDARITEKAAMQAVWQAEVGLGNHPNDVSAGKLGYDIESLDPRTGHMRFIEVKGRRPGAKTVTVTHNEIMRCINSPQQFILALVLAERGQANAPRYVRAPFREAPDLNVTSVNYDLPALLARSEEPG